MRANYYIPRLNPDIQTRFRLPPFIWSACATGIFLDRIERNSFETATWHLGQRSDSSTVFTGVLRELLNHPEGAR